MRNNVKRVVALAAVLIFCMSICAFGAENATVNLRIEGCYETFFSGEMEIPSDGILWTGVKSVLEENNISFTASPSAYGGIYVSEIGGDSSSMFGGYEGWMYTVNGVSPYDTMDAYVLNDGDDVVIYFGDYSGTVSPVVSVSSPVPMEGDDVVISVYKTVDLYDESWNYIGSETTPVENAVVTFDGNEFLTDENGAASISSVSKGAHTYSVKKNTENSYPELIRTGSATLYVSAVLPVRIERSATESGIKFTFTPSQGVSNVQIAYTIKNAGVPVSCEINPVNIEGGYSEEIPVSDGCTVKCTVFTDVDTSYAMGEGNMGYIVGMG